MRLWKVLSEDRESLVSGIQFKYPPKAWTRHLKPETLALCETGYHYCEGKQVLEWLRMGSLCEVEPCPKHKPIRSNDKCVSCRLRILRTFPLDARVLRLFACDCAERALLRERKQGREPAEASWKAVRITRLYLDGNASEEARSAAYSAAQLAATLAASSFTFSADWSAPVSADWSAETARRSAAYSAADSASSSTADAAPWSAARSAAYSAADSAAYSAAAADPTGLAASWLAANSAEQTRQYHRLLNLVGAV